MTNELYSKEIEEIVISTVVNSQRALSEVEIMLKPEYFFIPFHKDIIEAIHELIRQRRVVDEITILSVIKNKTPQTAYFLSQITICDPKFSCQEQIHILAQYYFRRKFIDYGNLILAEINNGKDFFEIKDLAGSGLLEIQKEYEGIRGEKDFSKIVSDVEKMIDKASETHNHISGIPTGNKNLDYITGGWQKTDLIILAARPGMGKTARALNFLKIAVENSYQCLFISLEMSKEQLVIRLLAEGSGLDLADIKTGRLSIYSREEIKNTADFLKTLPIKVNDNARTTIYDIASKCRILKSQGKLDFLIVDYLQITKGGKNDWKLNRDQLIGMFTGEFKAIAKECDIPVMVLSQLNRKTEGRPDLEHLRESGSIEQDADFVGFLYRPAYYTKGDQSKETDSDFAEMDNQEYLKYSEFIIAKHRNGKLAIIKEYFNGMTQKFTDTLYKEIEQTENLPF